MIFPSFSSVIIHFLQVPTQPLFLAASCLAVCLGSQQAAGGWKRRGARGFPGLTSAWLWRHRGVCTQQRLSSTQQTPAQSASGLAGLKAGGAAGRGHVSGEAARESSLPRLGLRCSWGGSGSSVSLRHLLDRPPTLSTHHGLPVSDLGPRARPRAPCAPTTCSLCPDHIHALALLVSRP